MKRKFAIVASAAVMTVLGTLPLAAGANEQIEAAVKKHRAATEELKAALGASKDAATAKANAPKIEVATKKQSAAEAELGALMPKLDPKKDGPAFEKAMAEVHKSNQEVGEIQVKALANKDTAPEISKAIKAK